MMGIIELNGIKVDISLVSNKSIEDIVFETNEINEQEPFKIDYIRRSGTNDVRLYSKDNKYKDIKHVEFFSNFQYMSSGNELFFEKESRTIYIFKILVLLI